MANKIRVYGRSQNRTALGVMHAYLTMHPKATMADLEKAFPKTVNPDSGWPTNFAKRTALTTENELNFWFIEDNELLRLSDGTQVAVVKMWTKESLEKLVKRIGKYEIETAPVSKGHNVDAAGFRLEYLNGYKPKKGCFGMIIALVALATTAIAAAWVF